MPSICYICLVKNWKRLDAFFVEQQKKIRRENFVRTMHSASSRALVAGRTNFCFIQQFLFTPFTNILSLYSEAMAPRSFEMSVYSLFLALVWIYGLGVEACSSSKHNGDFRVIRKTDSDSDRVIVSLDEDTRYAIFNF